MTARVQNAALVISTTKYGFFVELTELFIEGLFPIDTLPGDGFYFSEPTRQIIGSRTRKTYSIGDAARVRLDRADPIERKLQFAVVDSAGTRARRHGKKKSKQ